MKLSLAISPCPNDTFIFGPLVNGWIDTKGMNFDVVFRDVQALNEAAKRQDFDICKISFAAYPELAEHYRILSTGAALGRGCGPLLVYKDKTQIPFSENRARVGIPGKNTTANALLSMAYPMLTNKQEMLFSEIEHAVLEGDCAFGLLIHEKRFTYASRGLRLEEDLGEWWEKNTGEAIPLGAIAVNRGIGEIQSTQIGALIRESIRFSFSNPEKIMPFVAKYADEMDSVVMKQHIDLYVNEYSLELGKGGIFASQTFFRRGAEAGLFRTVPDDWLIYC